MQNLVFVERLDLITWLEGASEESEYIKPLEGAAGDAAAAASVAAAAAAASATTASVSATVTRSAEDSANVASGAAGGVATVSSAGGAKAGAATGVSGSGVGKTVDVRLLEIYNGERKLGDRNSVLRGIKATVCVMTSLFSCEDTTD